VRPADELFCEAIKRMLDATPTQHTSSIRIVVRRQGDPRPRALSTALEQRRVLGRDRDERDGGDRRLPVAHADVALIERDMPVVDGFHVLQEMGRHRELGACPSS